MALVYCWLVLAHLWHVFGAVAFASELGCLRMADLVGDPVDARALLRGYRDIAGAWWRDMREAFSSPLPWAHG